LVSKVTFAFSFFLHQGLWKEQIRLYTYSHSNDEIKKVIGKLQTAAIASEPIHCPTNVYQILTDMNKIPIEAGAACFMRFFYIFSS
jgi:alanine dehydrogenase